MYIIQKLFANRRRMVIKKSKGNWLSRSALETSNILEREFLKTISASVSSRMYLLGGSRTPVSGLQQNILLLAKTHTPLSLVFVCSSDFSINSAFCTWGSVLYGFKHPTKSVWKKKIFQEALKSKQWVCCMPKTIYIAYTLYLQSFT